MPRQTASQYYQAHRQLRRFWLTRPGLFAELAPTEQWQLHDYFQPNKDWPKGQLLQHRADITKLRPSLPQQAGRAYAKFQNHAAGQALRVARSAHAAPTPRSRKQDRIISVKAAVRPEPDLHKLARALVQIAKDQQRQEHDRLEGS